MFVVLFNLNHDYENTFLLSWKNLDLNTPCDLPYCTRSTLRPRLVTNNALMTYSSALALLSIREEPFRATFKRTKLHQEFTILPYNTCTRSWTLLSLASNNECLTLTLSLRVLMEMWYALADLGPV